jgi:threonine synthase
LPFNPSQSFNPRLTALSCFACSAVHDHRVPQSVCTRCGMPLRADYALDTTLAPPKATAVSSLWRYADVLPLARTDAADTIVTLTEGWTPLVPAGADTWIKDEARNPTGSFKARGMAVAVSVARLLGARALAAPSAGNAAGALAAYGAAARLPVTVAIPDDTPRAFIEECRLYGADVHLVPGTIADAGRWLKANGPAGAFDVSTLREPYRLEGKKTMAYELYEQFDSALPDVIVYPTGGGTGLIGMWKAFAEMRAMGWLPQDGRLPRLVSVQAAGCAPVALGFEKGLEKTSAWEAPTTRAYGLRVPAPLGGFLCLRAIRETSGTAVAVDEAAIGPATRTLASMTGVDVCPEGGAAWAATAELRASGWIRDGERVVVFNTGTGLKYR